MDGIAISLDTTARTVLARVAEHCSRLPRPAGHSVVVVRGPGQQGINQAAHLRLLLEQRGVAVTGAFAHECAALAGGTTPIFAVIDLSPPGQDEATLIAAHRSVPLFVAVLDAEHQTSSIDYRHELVADHMFFATPDLDGYALSRIAVTPTDEDDRVSVRTQAQSVEGGSGSTSVRIRERHLEIDVSTPPVVHLCGAIVTISAGGPLSLIVDGRPAGAIRGPVAVDCRPARVLAQFVTA